MFSHYNSNQSYEYENYNHQSNCFQCSNSEFCDSVKSLYNKIKLFFLKKSKSKNKNLNSKLLLADDY